MFFRSLAQKNTNRIVLILGGPASGKSTQASFLHELIHVSTGALIREKIKQDTQCAFVHEKALVDAGDLIDDMLITQLLKPCLRTKQDILLDGYPRNIKQWNLFKAYFGLPAAAIFLDLTPEKMLENTKMRGRHDDKAQVARHRITLYQQKTLPTIILIKQAIPNFIHVNAEMPDHIITQNIRHALDTIEPLAPSYRRHMAA